MVIPITSLHDLPIGAGYIRKDGRSAVEVRKTGNQEIEVSSRCDSLEILLDEMIIENERLLKSELDLQEKLREEVSKTSKPSRSLLGVVELLSAMLLIALGVYYRRKFKKQLLND